MHSRDMLRKAKGDHLDQVHSDQKILEMIRHGEDGPCYRRPRVTNSKKTVGLESNQIRWFSRYPDKRLVRGSGG
jgi:hypothetical protein